MLATCPECRRLQLVETEAGQKLKAAQQVLARHRAPGEDFGRLWSECEAAQLEVARVREERERHAVSHRTG